MMKMLGRVLAIVLVTGLAVGTAWADEEGKGNKFGQGRKGGRRGEGQHRRAPGGMVGKWFMEKEDVKAEMEKHAETVRGLFEQLKELHTANREKMRDAEDQAGREALIAEAQAAAKEVFAQIVDERIRHEGAKLQLMKKYRDDAVAAFEERIQDAVEKRRGQGGRGQGGGQGGGHGPRGEGQGKGLNEMSMDEFEGAVF